MLNVRKHFAGLALFTIILGSAVIIKNLLTYPSFPIPYTDSTLPFSARDEAALDVDYRVRLVSLDFINKQTYTSLVLELRPGRSAPQALRVTNQFFSPEFPGRVWTSTAEIRQPFARGDRLEYVANASCDFCSSPDAPRSGYFARVDVSTTSSDQTNPSDVSTDITTAERVVVQAEKMRTSSITR